MAGGGGVVGADQFHELGRRLKAAGTGGGGMRRELGKGLRAGAKPLVEDAQKRVQDLPITGHRGGASARQARTSHALRNRKNLTEKAKQRAHSKSGLRASAARATASVVSTGAKTSTLRVRSASAKMPPGQRKLPRYLNRGTWRHPVFNNRRRWVTQTAPPAWFDDAAEAKGPPARDHALDVVAHYLDKLDSIGSIG